MKTVLAVLRSTLGDAVRTRRLTHNPAEHLGTLNVVQVERVPWTADQAAHFLDHIEGDRLAELFELIVGNGLRRGEALALRWSDVGLERRVLRVRRAVTDVGGRLGNAPLSGCFTGSPTFRRSPPADRPGCTGRIMPGCWHGVAGRDVRGP